MTAPSDRLWALPKEKRDRLLNPARAEFIEHGYAGASLNRILTHAKMSKGQAYYYIAGKSDLYLAVCTRDIAPFLALAQARAKALCDAGDYWMGVEGLAHELVQWLEEHENAAALALTVYGSASAMECLKPLTVQLDAILKDIVQAGQNAGEVRTDLPDGLLHDMLAALILSLDRWFALHALALSPLEVAQTFSDALEMIRNMVQPPSKGDPNA